MTSTALMDEAEQMYASATTERASEGIKAKPNERGAQ